LKTSAASKEEPAQAGSEKIFSQELVMAVADHIPLLLIGPLLVALAGYLFSSPLPMEYKSTSVLRIDRPTARSIEALVTSPAVADAVLSKYAGTGDSPESRAVFLSEHLHLTDSEPGSERPGERLFRLDVTHYDPRTAQSISSDLIDAWLASTPPRGTERADLEAELERNKLAEAANSKLIDKIQGETTKLLAPNTMAGELATPISALISKRDQQLAAINAINRRLQGITRDVVVVSPHLPRDPIPLRRRPVAILYGVAAIPVFLALILLGRYFAPGVSVYDVLSRRFRRAT